VPALTDVDGWMAGSHLRACLVIGAA